MFYRLHPNCARIAVTQIPNLLGLYPLVSNGPFHISEPGNYSRIRDDELQGTTLNHGGHFIHVVCNLTAEIVRNDNSDLGQYHQGSPGRFVNNLDIGLR